MDRKIDSENYSTPQPNVSSGPAKDQSQVIPVIEEKIKVGKQVTETGSVRISKRVHHEEVTVDEPIVHEQVEMERVPVNQYVESPPPAVRYEGDKMIIPVLKEVVEKRLILVEEIHITKRQEKSYEPQQVTLRKEEVQVERVSGEPSRSGPNTRS